MTAEAGNELKSLRTLRDEVKLKAHLAGMELRTEWDKLEPQVEKAISGAFASEATLVGELKARLLALQQRLAYPPKAAGP